MNLKQLWWVGVGTLLAACGGAGRQPGPEKPWQREAKFRTFLNLATAVPVDSSRKVLDTLIGFYAEDSVAFRQLQDFLTPPLSDPNSPLRNDELYIPLLEAVIASPFYDTTEKIRPAYRLALARNTRVGQPAAVFAYTLAAGRSGRLYEVAAPRTLVYINNPDCHACEEILADLKASPVIGQALTNGLLRIVAIYPDKDLTAWRKHLKETPGQADGWINGYDATLAMRREELYDLRAIPSLYLLDEEKRVLLKDCTSVGWIEAYLMQGMR